MDKLFAASEGKKKVNFNKRSNSKMEREIREIQRIRKKRKPVQNRRSSKNIYSDEELADAKEFNTKFREEHRESANRLMENNKEKCASKKI